MDPYIKITKKFTKKFGVKVIKRQYFHRKTGLQTPKPPDISAHVPKTRDLRLAAFTKNLHANSCILCTTLRK